MKISVVIPVYNEEDNIRPLAEELQAPALRGLDLEAVFVDDGSRDATWAQIETCSEAFPAVRGLRMPRNCGQSAAMLAGLRSARGDILVTMDGDLQNDPADIVKLIEALDDGTDVVCGWREKRRDRWSRRVASRIGNAVRNRFTRDGIRDTGCSLKAFRRPCIDDLPCLDGVHRFMPAYFQIYGRTIRQIPVTHRHRIHGSSKYTNWRRLPRTVFDLVGFCWYRRRCLRVLRDPSLPV